MTPTVATLEWRPHSRRAAGEQALHEFPNGLKVSILRGNDEFWCTDDGTYELMLRRGPEVTDDETAPTWLQNDTMDWQTEEQVNAILAEMAAYAWVKE